MSTSKSVKTTDQPNAPEGYKSFSVGPEHHGMKNDYDDYEYLITSLPQPVRKELQRDGWAECLCTGWLKRMILSTPGFPSPIEHPAQVRYEIRKSGSRGLGVFATEDIDAGDLILAERPLLVRMIWTPPAPNTKHLSPKQRLEGMYADMERSMETLASRLEPERLELYRALYNSHKTDGSGPLSGIMRTNGLPLGEVEDPTALSMGLSPGQNRYSCVGAKCSRFNHSCSPNAVYTFSVPSFSMEIHAVRPIAKGDEITVTYALEDEKAMDRQASLKPYGFTCVCLACQSPATSDKVRERAIRSLLPKTSQGIDYAETALAAYEATGLQCHKRYLELLRRVAKINRAKGNKERADALDALAESVTTAQRGRNPQFAA
ncbi:unnamed protein product [Peniophora sp. CBMAI 1063]|nr:unnamed protein product [Peniophora sp. CBMAI 1063]